MRGPNKLVVQFGIYPSRLDIFEKDVIEYLTTD